MAMKSILTLTLGLSFLAVGQTSAGCGPTPSVAAQPTWNPKALAVRLVEALKDEDPVVVQNLATALVCLGPPAVPALTEALSHSDKAVRANAAEVLGRMGSQKEVQSALPALLKALKDKEVMVRRTASSAIAQIAGYGRGVPVPPSPYTLTPPAYSNGPMPPCIGR
jgi:hypothetical protein